MMLLFRSAESSCVRLLSTVPEGPPRGAKAINAGTTAGSKASSRELGSFVRNSPRGRETCSEQDSKCSEGAESVLSGRLFHPEKGSIGRTIEHDTR